MNNLRRKYILWLFVILPTVFFAVGFIFFSLDFGTNAFENSIIVIVLFSWGFFVYFKVTRIKCPQCDRPLHPFDRGIAEWDLRDMIPSKNCRSCNYDLTGRSVQDDG